MSKDCHYRNGCIRDYQKGWSNVVGYGNIKLTNVDPNNEFVVDNRTTPWNRIQGLDYPYSTPVNIKNAWTPPVSNNMTQWMGDCNSKKPPSKKMCTNYHYLK